MIFKTMILLCFFAHVLTAQYTIIIDSVEVKRRNARGKRWDATLKGRPDLYVVIKLLNTEEELNWQQINREYKELYSIKKKENEIQKLKKKLQKYSPGQYRYKRLLKKIEALEKDFRPLAKPQTLKLNTLQNEVTRLRKTFFHTTRIAKSTFQMYFNSKAFKVNVGSVLAIKVMDRDLFNHDLIGQYRHEIKQSDIDKGSINFSFHQVSKLTLSFAN